MPTTLGREPALCAALAAVAIKLVAAFGVHVTADQQAALNALVAAAVGLYVARATKDGMSAALLGFIQAGIALAVGFGLHWSADVQATVMSFAAAVVAMFVRTQVTAPVPATAPPASVPRPQAPTSRPSAPAP